MKQEGLINLVQYEWVILTHKNIKEDALMRDINY